MAITLLNVDRKNLPEGHFDFHFVSKDWTEKKYKKFGFKSIAELFKPKRPIKGRVK